MDSDRIAIDETQRLRRHGYVRDAVESRVTAEIHASAAGNVDADAARIEALAGELRSKAIDHVAETDAELERQRRFARIRQFVDYAFSLIYSLLALRFVLGLIGARQGAGFAQLVNTLTAPLYAPFRGILPTEDIDQGYVFSPSLLLAILVYVLLHASIKGLLRLIGRRENAL
jgi:uncharacterized protein YggT (Ycf19 family)